MQPGSEAPEERRSFRSALGWSYLMYGGQYVITTAVTFVLAGILGPTVFGLVAMAMVYLMFVQMLLRQGMVPALVQRRDLRPEHIDSAFWMIIGSGAVLTVASLALSGWWATVNNTPELRDVIVALTPLIPIQSLIVVQVALLNRSMDFKGLAIRTASASLGGGAVGLVLAVAGFGVWALVGQHLVKSLVEMFVLWRISDWRPSWRFSRSAARDLLGFTSGSALSGLGSFVNDRADALLIGLFFGPRAVGLYRLASRLVDMVSDVAVRALQHVSLPELSRLQDDPASFSKRVKTIATLGAVLSLPAYGILAGASSQLMSLIGDEWLPAVDALKVLCLIGAGRALTTLVGPVISAIGRPHLLAAISWISAVASAGGFIVAGVAFGEATIDAQVVGIAVVRVLVYSGVAVGLSGWAIVRFTSVTPSMLKRAYGPSALAGVVAFLAAQLCAQIRWENAGAFLEVVIVAIPSALIAFGLLYRIEPVFRNAVASVIPLSRRTKSDAVQNTSAKSE